MLQREAALAKEQGGAIVPPVAGDFTAFVALLIAFDSFATVVLSLSRLLASLLVTTFGDTRGDLFGLSGSLTTLVGADEKKFICRPSSLSLSPILISTVTLTAL